LNSRMVWSILDETCKQRGMEIGCSGLLQRQCSNEAGKKSESTDLPNARVIEETRKYADRMIFSEDIQR
jgi:hypothetical protein